MKDLFYGFCSFTIILHIVYMVLADSNVKKYNPKYKIGNGQFFEYFYLTDSIYTNENIKGIEFVNILDKKKYILSNYNIEILK